MSDPVKLANLVTAIATMTASIKTAIETRTAPDSLKLGNKTLAELEAQFGADTANQVAQISADLATFIARTDNPHAVTAAQVGLGAVQNLPLATVPEAQAGVVDTSYMTPAKSKAHFDARWAEKVGAAPETLDTIDEIAAAIAANQTTMDAIQAIADGKASPADVTAAIDALRTEVAGNLATGLALKLDATATAVNSAKLEGKTKAEVIAEALVAANLASKLDATAQAVDSDKLNGSTQAQLTASSAETITGTSTLKFTTPAGVRASIDAKAATLQSSIDANGIAISANATAITTLDGQVNTILDDLTAAFNDAATNV